jgi:hypothetical protein
MVVCSQNTKKVSLSLHPFSINYFRIQYSHSTLDLSCTLEQNGIVFLTNSSSPHLRYPRSPAFGAPIPSNCSWTLIPPYLDMFNEITRPHQIPVAFLLLIFHHTLHFILQLYRCNYRSHSPSGVLSIHLFIPTRDDLFSFSGFGGVNGDGRLLNTV